MATLVLVLDFFIILFPTFNFEILSDFSLFEQLFGMFGYYLLP